jgi:nitrous oxide reductase accessory protein NosL
MKKFGVILFLIVLFGTAHGASLQPIKIEGHQTCPLCGMYPARYPQFNCQIVFKDGSYEAFDSAVGLLVYRLFPDNTAITLKPIAKIYFKDYIKEGWLEAGKTFFVTGSEIMGPMGVEFLPVDSQQAAKELKKQEQGQDIIHFKAINRQYMIKAAKAGRLHYLAKQLVLK